ncbi:MAG: glutamate N-acetyltransferase / amino-acid N-acetyltransferase [Candidatus Binataceae bacterium]|jgi:glutamate N-acetyltransferase/amino-acid N-acetyltransferase|nr:glutamate N-acetyltransferase / amino-acid N-acetyltransferase [Candidatus Binataceae bacterium]
MRLRSGVGAVLDRRLEVAMKVRLEPAPVRGFRFAGVCAGLRNEPGRKDLGLIAADRPVTAAGVFTTNRVKAAPVVVSQERVRRGQLQAVAANSGSANCFTGKAGLKLANDSAAAVARAIGCPPELVAPCSTGVIGRTYDLAKYRAGVAEAVAVLASDRFEDFARAIMTTDTHPKIASATFRLSGAEVTIAGCAKGAGMIEPKMATMLAFVMTDAAVRPPALRRTLAHILPQSFNAITVDGDMSTNDTLLLMASGAARNRTLAGRDLKEFEAAVGEVSSTLAHELVRDGEGATKLVTVEVRGARTTADADRVARQIANSPLVKTAFFGCDPNFGRILMAAGKAGVALDLDRIEVSLGGIRLASRGALHTKALEAAAVRMKQPEFALTIDLKLGQASAKIVTCDLSFDYVKINAEYTT